MSLWKEVLLLYKVNEVENKAIVGSLLWVKGLQNNVFKMWVTQKF